MGKKFEKFVDKFQGHVAQQQHMGYILNEGVAALWTLHGDPQVVLRIGMAQKIHQSLHYISHAQFLSDVVWLFGALQQSITGRGRQLIRRYEHTQDGIIVWKALLDTYRYDGHVDNYLANQQKVLTRKFHAKYPGGMLQFLEDYENAFMNIEYVMQRQQGYLEGDAVALHTDNGKRRLFIQNFHVPDLTDNLIENVEHNTDTWDAMVDDLRRRLAKRNHHALEDARGRAHQAVTAYDEDYNDETPTSQPEISASIFQALNHPAFINALNSDWRVGYELWKKLPRQIQEQITGLRDEHFPQNSGGSIDTKDDKKRVNFKQNDKPHGSSKDIVRGPTPRQPEKGIPMQYSSNKTAAEVTEEDEDVKTILSYLATANNIRTYKAHTNYLAMLSHTPNDLCITDGGADSHVGGRTWLPLTPLSGPTVKFANVTGFDEESAKKFGLPIVQAVIKATSTDGQTIMLRAKHLIYNASCPHTLLSTYQMRELGLIVDDVSKRHLKDAVSNGTHSITFPQSDKSIDLTTRAALSTFSVSKPTLQEYLDTPEEEVLDIALEHWNPQEHNEESLENSPSIPIPNQIHSLTNTEAKINMFCDLTEEPPLPELATEEENEELFFDAIETSEPPFDEVKELNSTDSGEGKADILKNTGTNDSGEEIKEKGGGNKARITKAIATILSILQLPSTGATNAQAAYNHKHDLQFHDAIDPYVPDKPGKVMHLSIDYQILGQGVKGNPECFIASSKVNKMLTDLDYKQLTGHSESFNTLAHAITTIEQMQKIEAIQPRLAWKPLDVIKRTLENTTQWGKTITQYPMKKHHISRFPWNNRRRLREEVAMDTIFMANPGFCGSTCAQVFVGLMSRMINVYPMPSKACGYVLKAYQDFMRYEGVPEGLHRDLAPEEKVEKIIDLNRQMMVRDTWSEQGHPNQNPAEALGVKPLKTGTEQLMNRTGAPPGAWPWAQKYIADINNHCATPFHGWRTPISVRHGYTPDISAFLQFQFWEKVYFKIDEQAPNSKEAPGYWMGVSNTIGDAMTYDIWSDRTRKVIQRSAVRSADPNRGGIPNLRVEFAEDIIEEEPELIDPVNVLDDPNLLCPPKPKRKPGDRTNKHKKRWHDTHEAPPEDVGFYDSQQDETPMEESDFTPTVTPDELSQSHPARREKLQRSCRKLHLISASALLSLTQAHSYNTTQHPPVIIDSGINITPLGDSHLRPHDPFDPSSSCHILETALDSQEEALSNQAFIRKIQLQYFDAQKDNEDDSWDFVPTGVLAHRISTTPRRTKITAEGQTPTYSVTTSRHLRVLACWKNGETSWVSADSLKEQNPWVLVNYAVKRGITKHPDFQWTTRYIRAKDDNYNILAAKGHQGLKFKFGVQIPMNSSHALHLDKVHNNNLWKEAIQKEIDSINAFKTFRVLDEGEKLPEGYARIPYQLIYDCKFDGRRKCRLVLGGHRTPDVHPDEVYSGVVSMETVRTAFVLGALNNLEVCAADISTAFLYGKTREKVYIIAGKEFGEHAGKRMIVDGSCYGLKTSSARFHEELSSKLRKLGFRPSKADFDLWIRPQNGYYEYVTTYVDDILAFSKNPMSIIEEIRKDFSLKGVGKPEYYLGGNFHSVTGIQEANDDDHTPHLSSKWLKEGVKMAFSARTYIDQCMNKLEEMMGTVFPTKGSPMSDLYHPEVDDSPLLTPEEHSKFRSLVGCANWLVTLGRFDIAYAVNTLSRFSMAPRQGHLQAMMRVFGYLKKWSKGTIIIDPKYPDHSQFDIADYDTWKEFYPDAEEMIPGPEERPEPKGPKVRITVYKDADHAHDVVTRRSVSGVLLFLNNTPVKWVTKRQKTVETSTYGAELVAAKIATELILEYRYALRMMGAEPDGPALLLGDNNSVVLNCTMPSSVLKKKASACSYHRVREAIASGVMKFAHITSDMNYADILTKPVPGPQFRELVRPLLFRVPKD